MTFLFLHNGIFNVTNRNKKFYVKKAFIDEDFFHIRIPKGAYETELLNDEIKRILIDEEYYTEAAYPFKIKPSFSTLGSIITISPQGPIVGFVFDDSIGNLLGFNRLYYGKNIIYHLILLIFFR